MVIGIGYKVVSVQDGDLMVRRRRHSEQVQGTGYKVKAQGSGYNYKTQSTGCGDLGTEYRT